MKRQSPLLMVTVHTERSSCPCFAAALSGSLTESVRSWRSISFRRLMKDSRCISHKRKIPPCKTGEKFCRVKRRQNKSGVLRGGKKSSWGINPHRSVLFYKFGWICDREYHGLQRASRWFCKFYCSKAVIVGLII